MGSLFFFWGLAVGPAPFGKVPCLRKAMPVKKIAGDIAFWHDVNVEP